MSVECACTDCGATFKATARAIGNPKWHRRCPPCAHRANVERLSADNRRRHAGRENTMGRDDKRNPITPWKAAMLFADE